MRSLAAEWKEVDEADLTDEVSFGLDEWGFTAAEYRDFHRWAVTQRELFTRMRPIAGASSTLRRLSDRKIHIRIITHRLVVPNFHNVAIEQTAAWLDRHAIPYWDLCFVGEKGHVDADLYVEDSPENLTKLVDQGRSVIAFTNSTNRSLEMPLRASSWAEVEEIALRQHERWQGPR